MTGRHPTRAHRTPARRRAPESAGEPWIDPWLVRHLLLSIEDRERSLRDEMELDVAVARSIADLCRLPPPPLFLPPPGSVAPPGLLFGVPGWIFETNSWVLAPRGPGGPCAVFDVSPDPRSLLTQIHRWRLRPSAVFLTHGHLDHVGGVGHFLEAIGTAVPVYIHTDDVSHARRPSGVDAVLARALGPDRLPAPELTPLGDGAEVAVGGLVVRAMHAPGHTPGTICYMADGDPGLLFSGDQLFADGMGRTDLPGGSLPGMMASMRDRIVGLSDHTVVLPGHGAATTIGAARAVNPFLAG